MKEATIVRGIKNEHVVRLKAACLNLCAVMLEYVYFDFTPFGGSERVSNLYDFLLLTESRAVIQQFPFHYRLSQGVGLPTQSRNSASGHYCTMTDMKALQQLLKEMPIICKLATLERAVQKLTRQPSYVASSQLTSHVVRQYTEHPSCLEIIQRLHAIYPKFKGSRCLGPWYGLLCDHQSQPEISISDRARENATGQVSL